VKSSKKLSLHTGEGIVIDIGTGDGRFVSAAAKTNPNMFFIGVDANVKPLEKPSMRATRKPAKGGLPNVMFVQAAVESLPEEFAGLADEVHIHFPWGSLLRAVAMGEPKDLKGLRRITKPGGFLEIVFGLDPVRDHAELERLGISDLTPIIIHSFLVPRYISAGFEPIEIRTLDREEQIGIQTSWAKRLRSGDDRTVHHFLFKAV
jgi:16S rRNA (adenine(1408)-N(1))-methyltransferase